MYICHVYVYTYIYIYIYIYCYNALYMLYIYIYTHLGAFPSSRSSSFLAPLLDYIIVQYDIL